MSGYGQTSFFVLPACRLVLFWADTGPTEITLGGNSAPYGESTLPFLLSRIGLTISVPVLPISDAKLCIRQRKALHLPTQSFASANAKLCNRPRKALQSSTQSFALTLPQIRLEKVSSFWNPFPMFSRHLVQLGVLCFPFQLATSAADEWQNLCATYIISEIFKHYICA